MERKWVYGAAAASLNCPLINAQTHREAGYNAVRNASWQRSISRLSRQPARRAQSRFYRDRGGRCSKRWGANPRHRSRPPPVRVITTAHLIKRASCRKGLSGGGVGLPLRRRRSTSGSPEGGWSRVQAERFLIGICNGWLDEPFWPVGLL
jgi:hypothetical protein